MKLSLRPNEKLSILIVDDEPDIRETLVTFLDMMNIFSYVVEAADGAQAFLKFQNQKFDIIVTDLIMPKVRGITLIENIRREEKTKGAETITPIVILSANLTGEEMQKAMRKGIKYIVTKPCTAEQFIEKIQEVIKKEHREKVKITKT